jgi:hypothetical protein
MDNPGVYRWARQGIMPSKPRFPISKHTTNPKLDGKTIKYFYTEEQSSILRIKCPIVASLTSHIANGILLVKGVYVERAA